MRLKITPRVGKRYWCALLLASMLGTNLGDLLLEVFRIPTGLCLLVLAIAFGGILVADRLSARGCELLYWLAILAVRAAATTIADFAIDLAHLGYLTVAAVLTFVLAALVAVQLRSPGKPSATDIPSTTGVYWLAMLVAGTLGTIMGDGLGHAFGEVQISVPVSAGLATLSLAAVFGVMRLPLWRSPVRYWIAIVIVRWWGTNFGDIFKYLASIEISISVTAAAMVMVLLFWRSRNPMRRSS